jgi:hypothetical protein
VVRQPAGHQDQERGQHGGGPLGGAHAGALGGEGGAGHPCRRGDSLGTKASSLRLGQARLAAGGGEGGTREGAWPASQLLPPPPDPHLTVLLQGGLPHRLDSDLRTLGPDDLDGAVDGNQIMAAHYRWRAGGGAV